MESAREIVRERRPSGLRGLVLRAGLGVLVRPLLLRAGWAVADRYARSGVRRLVARLLPARVREMDALLGAAEGPSFRGSERADADIALFTGCVMTTAFGDTHRATVRLLERAGRRVGVPAAQACCGALHAHSGDGKGARALARRNVAAFGERETPIVVNAAGCGAHLKAYGEVLAGDPDLAPAARRFARRVRDASEAIPPEAVASEAPRVRVVYQDACHLAHGQKVRRQPRDLLRAVRGVELVTIADPERCCGSAGIYNLTHPEVASELQRQKVAAVLDAAPDVVVSANPGCIFQLRAGLRAAGSEIPVVHLARFLDDPRTAGAAGDGT